MQDTLKTVCFGLIRNNLFPPFFNLSGLLQNPVFDAFATSDLYACLVCCFTKLEAVGQRLQQNPKYTSDYIEFIESSLYTHFIVFLTNEVITYLSTLDTNDDDDDTRNEIAMAILSLKEYQEKIIGESEFMTNPQSIAYFAPFQTLFDTVLKSYRKDKVLVPRKNYIGADVIKTEYTCERPVARSYMQVQQQRIRVISTPNNPLSVANMPLFHELVYTSGDVFTEAQTNRGIVPQLGMLENVWPDLYFYGPDNVYTSGGRAILYNDDVQPVQGCGFDILPFRANARYYYDTRGGNVVVPWNDFNPMARAIIQKHTTPYVHNIDKWYFPDETNDLFFTLSFEKTLATFTCRDPERFGDPSLFSDMGILELKETDPSITLPFATWLSFYQFTPHLQLLLNTMVGEAFLNYLQVLRDSEIGVVMADMDNVLWFMDALVIRPSASTDIRAYLKYFPTRASIRVPRSDIIWDNSLNHLCRNNSVRFSTNMDFINPGKPCNVIDRGLLPRYTYTIEQKIDVPRMLAFESIWNESNTMGVEFAGIMDKDWFPQVTNTGEYMYVSSIVNVVGFHTHPQGSDIEDQASFLPSTRDIINVISKQREQQYIVTKKGVWSIRVLAMTEPIDEKRLRALHVYYHILSCEFFNCLGPFFISDSDDDHQCPTLKDSMQIFARYATQIDIPVVIDILKDPKQEELRQELYQPLEITLDEVDNIANIIASKTIDEIVDMLQQIKDMQYFVFDFLYRHEIKGNRHNGEPLETFDTVQILQGRKNF